jgi:RNA polymerase sigma-70 factor (ECF subfamily)
VPSSGGHEWIGPCPAALYADEASSPEAKYTARESVAFAFLAALQLLPPRQRAALIARDVLGWSAEECAEMLSTSVASANSALQRARDTLEERSARWRPRVPETGDARDLLARYVEAWEKADVGSLAALLHEEATLAMPPLPMWLRGADDIVASIGAMVLTPDARGAFLHVVESSGGKIVEVTAFLDPRVLGAFDLTAPAPVP